ncbi:DUF1127 domain-containing protein [Roseibium sp. LAB1]
MTVSTMVGRISCRWNATGILERWRRARRTRNLIQTLERMSDHDLRDIGLSRDCVRYVIGNGDTPALHQLRHAPAVELEEETVDGTRMASDAGAVG